MFSSNGIKSIFFDLDGTLRLYLPSGGEVFTDYAISLGLPVSDEDKRRSLRWEHYYFANSPEIQADQLTFKGDSSGFWVNYSRRRLIAMGCHPSTAIDLASQVSAYMGETYKPNVQIAKELPNVLSALQKAGYILGVVSNRVKPYISELEEMGLDSYFKFTLAGGEVPSYKPEPGIFLRALEIAETSAQETLYIGDNYYADVVGSHRAGLRPVLYDPGMLFPEAECAVIKAFDEILHLVGHASRFE